MSILISVHKLEKTMGDRKLFSELSFGIMEKQKRALLGPNGAGKSTLLKILSGQETFDSGEISPRKNLQMAFVSQEDVYPTGLTISQIAETALNDWGADKEFASIQASIHLSMAGFENLDIVVDKLSGGWRKRLSLAIAFAKEPELLLLDEPTNHLDWDGILWLEDQLKTFEKSFFLVSHDREFLKNQCQEFMELNRLYKDGFLSLKCSYEQFLEKKEEIIQSQISMQESMSNKARRETEWLRAGVKARTTKSQSRIKEAHQLIEDLGEVKSRNRAALNKVNIQIDTAGKRSKKFIETEGLSIAYGSNKILNNLNMTLGPKMILGLLGDNASGKTSLLKVLAREAENFTGKLYHANDVKIVYFDQKRQGLDQKTNLLEYLGDGSDHVNFKDRSLHVASYASQFLFDSNRMHLPIERLSGGEQARLLIAKLMLQPADILLLDEPTNDLDVETIEILEQSLLSFPGLVVIVSHDRYFMKSICQKFLALDGKGGWEFYSDLFQWLKHSRNKSLALPESKESTKTKSFKKIKLSYKDKRRFENIETEIAEAEKALAVAQKAVENNTDFSDHQKTQELISTLDSCQKIVDEVYQFWQETEEKLKAGQ